MTDVRYRYQVSLRNHVTGDLVKGVYRSRCSTIGGAVSQLEKRGHQHVTAIKKIYKTAV